MKDMEPKRDAKSWFVQGVDVGRNGDETVITTIKVRPTSKGVGIKHIVNIEVIENMPFNRQAIMIKKSYNDYQPRYIAIDANGVGQGLMDMLVLPTIDERNSIEYPAFGVYNDDKNLYKNLDTGNSLVIKEVLWMIKANSNDLNSEGYANLLTQFGSSKIKLLINEREAMHLIKNDSETKRQTHNQKQGLLIPYMQTSILKTELMNLTRSQTSNTFKLEQITKGVGKDRVSSLMYGMYVIKQIEDKNKRRKRRDLSSYMLVN